MIEIEDVAKTFTLHNQGGAVIRVMEGAHLRVAPGECVALTGASGAGKSTLLNALIPGLDQKTAEVSDVHDKGKHTTTFAEMFPLPGDGGGFIIDTPGIKGFGLVRMEKETLHHHFPEMFRLLPDCKFHNCRHLDEPGCAVRAALETGEVDDERYRNYRNMVEEFDEGPYRAGGKRGKQGI